ncbi:unnamed protein product [Lathyrus sativus]|nr:unnamed protein product [Lathyrus sativus]
MVSSPSFYSFLAIISLVFHLFCISSITAQNNGFTVKLFRKPSYSRSHLMRLSKNNPNAAHAPVHAYIGHYLMELNIGTPPVKISGIADTGSDLTWTSCEPCVGCYKQIDPLFNPLKSSTYSDVSCDTPLCDKLDTKECSPEKRCDYTYAYASSSVTKGVLAQETITLTSNTNEPVSLKGILFGCGHNNTGGFNDHEMGIVGLGRGPVSFVSQLGPLLGGLKFSQCLVPFLTDIKISSKLSFGKGSEVLGQGVVTTPMVPSPTPDKTPYLVTLEGITVENTYLPFKTSGTVAKGNMMIDSGTPPTILPNDLYERLVNEVKKKVSMEPIQDDPSLGNQLCYHTNTSPNGPNLTFHFEGADIVLTPIQIFIPQIEKVGVICLGVTNNSADGGIYGNFAQSNYLIGFDLEREEVSFKPTDCTRD